MLPESECEIRVASSNNPGRGFRLRARSWRRKIARNFCDGSCSGKPRLLQYILTFPCRLKRVALCNKEICAGDGNETTAAAGAMAREENTRCRGATWGHARRLFAASTSAHSVTLRLLRLRPVSCSQLASVHSSNSVTLRPPRLGRRLQRLWWPASLRSRTVSPNCQDAALRDLDFLLCIHFKVIHSKRTTSEVSCWICPTRADRAHGKKKIGYFQKWWGAILHGTFVRWLVYVHKRGFANTHIGLEKCGKSKVHFDDTITITNCHLFVFGIGFSHPW